MFTAGDDGWRTAADLAAAGVEVAVMVDARPGATPPAGPWRVPRGGGVATRGRRGWRGSASGTRGGCERIAVDCLAVAGGWNPTLHLSSHLGGRPVWDEAIAAFVPRPGAVPGLAAAGAAAGAFSTQAALGGGAGGGGGGVAELGSGRRRPRCRRRRTGRGGGGPLAGRGGRGGPGSTSRTT